MNRQMEKVILRGIVEDTASTIAQGIRNYVLVKEMPIISIECIATLENSIQVYVIKNAKTKEIIDSFTTDKRLAELLGYMRRRYNFKIERESQEDNIKFKLYSSN